MTDWAKVALPLICKTYGALLADELVSVQPMTMPSAHTWYMDFAFADDIGFDWIQQHMDYELENPHEIEKWDRLMSNPWIHRQRLAWEKKHWLAP